MTYYNVTKPYELFFDDNGDPLEDGYIYIGEVNENPITNPIDVFWDIAGLYPAAQPIRTIAGYPSRNGSPGRLFVDLGEQNDYSILIQDKNGEHIIYEQAVLTSNGLSVGGNVDTISDLREVKSGAYPVYVRGHTTVGDGGHGVFEWTDGAAPGTYADDNGIHIVPTGGDGSGAWIRQYSGIIKSKWFRATGDGTTNDLAAITSSITFTSDPIVVELPPGSCYLPAAGLTISRSNLTLIGNGVAGFTHNTAATFDGLITTTGSNIKIIGINFTNTATSTVSQIGIDIGGGSDIDIKDCYFENFRYAILGRTAASNVNVTNNRTNSGTYGLTGIVLNGTHLNINNNQVEKFGDTGIGVAGGSSNAIISSNMIISRDTGGASLGLIVEEDAENVIVVNNFINGNWDGVTPNYGVQYGIRISDNATGTCPKNVVVTGNTVINAELYGIIVLNAGAVRNASNVVLSNNVISGCGSSNIYLQDLDYSVISGNIAAEGANRGLHLVSGLDNCTNYGNVANNNTGFGMFPGNMGVGQFFGNMSVDNIGGDLEFIDPSFATEFRLNYGHSGTQRVGDMIHVVDYIAGLAAGTSIINIVEIVPDNARAAIYEAVAYIDTSGSTDADVQVYTVSSLGGNLAGTLYHGNDTRLQDQASPIVEERNSAGADRYLRIGIDNSSGSNYDVWMSVKYRVVGGDA